MFLTNYKNSLVNLSSSILKRFNVEPFHSTIPLIDKLLQKHNKIVVILMDGMNEYLLETHKDVTQPFLDNCFTKITSVYPPTTVAATTSFLTAKYPGETGYLGWSQPINNFTRNINVFSNRDTQTEELIPGENIINKLCPTQKIYDIINIVNKKQIADSVFLYPVDKNGPKTFRSFLRRLEKKARGKDECFIYGYYNEPDHTIHDNGVAHKKVKRALKKYTSQIIKYAKRNKDTLILVIADHGLIDIKPLFLDEHKDLKELLVYPFSLEVRTPNFKVKEGKKDEFKQLFNKYYGEDFVLMTKDEVISNNLFTDGKLQEVALQFIGDFVAFSKNESTLVFENVAPFKAHHAGMTKEEMNINVTVFNK